MNALKYDYFNAFVHVMFVSLGKGTLAPPIAYCQLLQGVIDDYYVPPSASTDSHAFPRQCWRPGNNMRFNGRGEEIPPLSGWD